MRSTLATNFLLLLVAATAAAQGPPPSQINPHTQIKWPAVCNNPAMVYNWQTNTCAIPTGVPPATANNGELIFNNSAAWGATTGMTWTAGTLSNPGGTIGAATLNASGAVNAATVSASGGITAGSFTGSGSGITGLNSGTSIMWPSSCTPGTLYNPSGNSCVAGGTGNNPGGTNLQIQFNQGGFFGGTSGITTDAATQSFLYGAANINNSQPASAAADIRNPAFAGGAKCNGTNDDTPALQAAINSLFPSTGAIKGGNILIPSGVSYTGTQTVCYIAHPELLYYPSSNPFTIYVTGTTFFGTTWTIPGYGPYMNILGLGGSGGASFQGPGQWANMSTRFPTGSPAGTGVGTLGTFNLGAGESASSFAVTTGAINSGSNQLTVADPTSYIVGDWIVVANSLAGGFTQFAHITAIAGNVFTLDVNAGSTQSAGTVSSGNLIGRVATFTPSTMGGLVAGPSTTGYINAGSNQLTVANNVFQNGQYISILPAFTNQQPVTVTAGGCTPPGCPSGSSATLTISANATTTVSSASPAVVGTFFNNGSMQSGTGADITVIDKLTCDMSSLSRAAASGGFNLVTGQTPTTTGSITSGTNTLTIAGGTFSNGAAVSIAGVTFNSQPNAIVTAGGGTTTLTLSSAASATVTSAAVNETCRIAVGSMLTVAGASDSTFNGGGQNANPPTNFRLISNDLLTGRMTWHQTGVSASTATGATASGTFEDTIENVSLLQCPTSTTCTGVFWRPHTSASSWGLDTMAIYGNRPNLMRDFQIGGYTGTGLIYTGFHAAMQNVGVTSAACNGNATNFSMTFMTGFVNMSGMSISTNCQPWGVRLTTPNNAPNGIAGPLYLKDSFVMGGIHGDHGGGVFTQLTNVICDQVTAACIMIDPTNYWSTAALTAVIDGTGFNDNPASFPNCYLYYEQPAYSGPTVGSFTLRNASTSGCITNEYYLGTGRSEIAGSYTINPNNVPKGPAGVINTGQQIVTENRSLQSAFGFANIPHATLAVPSFPGSWAPTAGTTISCATCTNVVQVDAPDGSFTAGRLTATSISGAYAYQYSGLTPAAGDLIIYGGWVRTLTQGYRAGSGGSGYAFTLDNAASTHWTMGVPGATTGGVNAYSSFTDAFIYDDWWHPVVSVAQVVTSDGTTGQTLRFILNSDPSKSMDYWMPFLIYVKASEGYPLREIMRWRQDLLHGAVTPNIPAAGVYSNSPVNTISDPSSPLNVPNKNYVDTRPSVSSSTLAQDTFQRFAGLPSSLFGPNWTISSTATAPLFSLSSPGTISMTGGTSSYYDYGLYTGAGFGTNQCSQITLQAPQGTNAVFFLSLLVNGSTPNTWYVALLGQNASNTLYGISRVVSGSTTSLVGTTAFTGSSVMTAGDKYTFCNTGAATNNLVVYRNNAAGPTTASDTTLTGGSPGFGMQQGYTTQKIGSFFASGQLPASTFTAGGSALAVGCTASASVTVSASSFPVTVGMVCVANGVGGNPANIQPICTVTALNTITPSLCTAVAGTPASQSYTYRIIP